MKEDKIQLSEFIKIFCQATRGSFSNEESWIDGIGNYLKSGSPAEKWFNQNKIPKKTWVTFKPAFKTQFPDIARAKKTAQDLERELLKMRLQIETTATTVQG